MSGNATPANVGSNDGLGPLPEYAHEFSPRWFGDDGGFTGAQMRRYALAAVAAERERCAMKLQVTRADVQLAAGELNTEEWRMCAAVLRWMQGRIRGPNVGVHRQDPALPT